MKKIFIIHFIAALLYIGGIIWTIAEALNYYIKGDSFNFLSLVTLGIGIFIAFINILFGIFKFSK